MKLRIEVSYLQYYLLSYFLLRYNVQSRGRKLVENVARGVVIKSSAVYRGAEGAIYLPVFLLQQPSTYLLFIH